MKIIKVIPLIQRQDVFEVHVCDVFPLANGKDKTTSVNVVRVTSSFIGEFIKCNLEK